MKHKYMVGTDIGGTFTDLVLLEPGEPVLQVKSPTTPDDRSKGVLDALSLAADAVGRPLSEFCADIVYFSHGTTAATNALIERKGARTALVTTAGFADALLIQRSMSSWVGLGEETGHYSRRRNPTPIVPRELRCEVVERVDATGERLVPLSEEEVRSLLRRLRHAGVEALAVSFLWSFLETTNERDVARLVTEECPGVYLTLSHEIAPVIGEYERTATTVINSYLGPVIRDYMTTLGGKLRSAGFSGELTIMDSGGGVMSADDAVRRSVSLLTSGPAGGVLACTALAQRLGIWNAITSDMGGTSFDVGLIVDGEPLVEQTSEVGDYHLALPRIRVAAIGAGGGSIASVDEVGALVVGPQSAGSVPGPACYGRGGHHPTVTDADVVLGIIDPDYFLGGRMTLDRRLAEKAIEEYVAGPLGMTAEEAAAGIRQVADNQMADLLRKVTVQQGRDPRDFSVFAYGGAGPTHATAYTAAAGIQTLIVPATSTVHSAFGAVSSDRFRATQITDVQRTPPGASNLAEHLDVNRLRTALEELERRCTAELGGDDRIQVNRYVYMKFRKQSHELPVPLPAGPVTATSIRQLVVTFLDTYERVYGRGTALPEAGIEVHTLRVEGRVPVPLQYDPSRAPGVPAGDDEMELEGRDVHFPRIGRVRTRVLRGELVLAGTQLVGPVILEFAGTTVVLGPGQQLTVDPEHNLIIDCQGVL